MSLDNKNSADNPTIAYEVDAPIAPPDNDDDSKVLVAGTPALTPAISNSYIGAKSPGMKPSPSARLFPLHTVRQGEHLV